MGMDRESYEELRDELIPATPRANTCAGSGASISTPTPVNTVI